MATPSTEKNYRVRFRDEQQLRLVQRAAKRHGLSLNTFVTHMAEVTAKLMLKRGARLPLDLLTEVATEVCSKHPDAPSIPKRGAGIKVAYPVAAPNAPSIPKHSVKK